MTKTGQEFYCQERGMPVNLRGGEITPLKQTETGPEHKRRGMSEFAFTEAGGEYRAGNNADIHAVFLHDGEFFAPRLNTCLQCAEVSHSTCGGPLNSGSETA